MQKEYKGHPLMMIKLIKPFLIVLLLPVVRAVIQYFTTGDISGLIGFEALALIIIVSLAFARYRAFRLICEEDKITVKTGAIIKREAKIDISKLSCVQTKQNVLDLVFRSITFKINTEAGTRGAADFEFRLNLKSGKELSHYLYGGEIISNQKFSAVKVALMAAATSSAFTGMIIGVPVINRAGNLLGLGLSRMLFDEISHVSEKFETTFPPIVKIVTLILLLAYFVSFVYLFFKLINYRVVMTDSRFDVRSGFFVLERTLFKEDSVNDVRIEQNPLMVPLKRYSMKVGVGGFSDNKNEAQVMVPAGKYNEIKRDFSFYFPYLIPENNYIKPAQTFLNETRFLYWPTIFGLLIIGLTVFSALVFKSFTRLILFLALVAMAINLFYAYVSHIELKRSRLSFGDTVFLEARKWFRPCELYCPKERIGQITISRVFMDFHYKTCKLRITVCSEGADTIRIRHVDYETAIKEVTNCFNLV